MKRSNEVDVDAIFRIDELLDTDEDGDEVPPERAAWYQEFEEAANGADDDK
jgi:hypothetical protein